MTQLKKYLLLFLLIEVIASCNTSIEVTKRRYSSGYHVDVNTNKNIKVQHPESKQDIHVPTKVENNNLKNSADISPLPVIIPTQFIEKEKISDQQVSHSKRLNKLINKVKTFAQTKSSVTSHHQLKKDPASTPPLNGGYSFFKIFLLLLLLAFLIVILLILILLLFLSSMG